MRATVDRMLRGKSRRIRSTVARMRSAGRPGMSYRLRAPVPHPSPPGHRGPLWHHWPKPEGRTTGRSDPPRSAGRAARPAVPSTARRPEWPTPASAIRVGIRHPKGRRSSSTARRVPRLRLEGHVPRQPIWAAVRLAAYLTPASISVPPPVPSPAAEGRFGAGRGYPGGCGKAAGSRRLGLPPDGNVGGESCWDPSP